MTTPIKILSPEVGVAIIDSFEFYKCIQIQRENKLNDLCDGELASFDVSDILRRVGVDSRKYFHDEAIDKKLLRYAVEEEKTELIPSQRDKLKDSESRITTTEILPYITAGHIERIVEYDKASEEMHTAFKHARILSH